MGNWILKIDMADLKNGTSKRRHIVLSGEKLNKKIEAITQKYTCVPKCSVIIFLYFYTFMLILVVGLHRGI